jgi:thiamine-phosphate pyrophosphorylase
VLDKMPVMVPTLAKAARNHKRCALPRLWLLSDAGRLPDPTAAAGILPRGAALILRHTDAKMRAELAHRLAPFCRRRGIVFSIAGDWRLAAEIGADGIHLGEQAARRGMEPGARLWLKAKGRILTIAAHGERALRRAARMDASAAILSPVFRTASHPARKPLGAIRAAALIHNVKRNMPMPVIALGGITQATVAALHSNGMYGIAGIGFALRA